jgi:hypothetical protein
MSTLACTVISAGLVLAIGLPLLSREQPAPQPVPTTVEVQEVERLWDDLGALQVEAAELGPDQYLRSVVARTAEFLDLDEDAAERFGAGVDEGLRALLSAREAMERAQAETGAQPMSSETIASRREAWSAWQADQDAAADLLLPALEPTARHNLLAEKRLFWLLRLDYGLRE